MHTRQFNHRGVDMLLSIDERYRYCIVDHHLTPTHSCGVPFIHDDVRSFSSHVLSALAPHTIAEFLFNHDGPKSEQLLFRAISSVVTYHTINRTQRFSHVNFALVKYNSSSEYAWMLQSGASPKVFSLFDKLLC